MNSDLREESPSDKNVFGTLQEYVYQFNSSNIRLTDLHLTKNRCKF